MPRIPDRFQILRRLGAGGFGIVYEALDRERGERVALKTLARASASALYRFKKEFRALADIAHDNLVRLHDLIGADDEWFFTMELVRGVDWLTHVRGQDAAAGAAPSTGLASTAPPDQGIDVEATLEDAMARWPAPLHASDAGGAARPEARADLVRVRSSLVQVARALRAVHEAQLVHRDLKPSNVLVTPEGRAVVLDFGIATHLTRGGQTATDAEQIVGTPLYMAPEQVGPRAVTPGADWYALGVMLFEALAGRPPYRGTALEVLAEKQRAAPPALRDIAPWAPGDLADLAADLLSASPEQRPSGLEVIRRLGAADGPVPAPRGGNAGRAARAEQGGRAAPATRAPATRAPATRAPATRATATHAPATRATAATRAQDLEALDGALAAVREGRPGLAVIRGAAGTGKSALVRAFLDGEAVADALVLEGRCHEREQVPYRALDGAIDALSRYLVRLPRPEAAALMPRGVASLARVFPVLARVPAVSAAPRGPGDEDEARLKERASAALRDLLGRISDRRPVIVLIEDAHWGDPDSASLLAEIMAPPDPAVILLILACRTDGAGQGPLLAALRACPAMAAVRAVELDLTGTPARRSSPCGQGS
ncbi:protein kinase domain-containing protein [Sorangium sp. So ce854]|uniref:serine/threonine-protein kinase n=1 Tax=Sorangium sp. So ce854 TaxID=3133322 RepID=UPI003F5DCBA4